MLDFLTAAWLGFMGACIGSFLNVVAYRVPRGESLIRRGSYCPRCGHAIRPWDNIPVLGWLMLKGRCRDCSKPISPRYAVVEAAMGGSFFLLAYVELFSGGANLPAGPISQYTGAVDNVWVPHWPLIGAYAYHCLLLCFLMPLALMEEDGNRAPKSLVIAGLLAGAIPRVVFSSTLMQVSPLGCVAPTAGVAAVVVVVGAAVGYSCGRVFDDLLVKRAQTDGNHTSSPKDWSLTLVGVFLGWQAVIAVTVMGLLGGLLLQRAPWRRPPAAAANWAIFFAAVILLCFWTHLAPMCCRLPADG